MANNRLYIGNVKTKDYMFVEKGWGLSWNGGHFAPKLLEYFLENTHDEANVGDKTNLIFFTENDECFDDFHHNGNKITLETSKDG